MVQIIHKIGGHTKKSNKKQTTTINEPAQKKIPLYVCDKKSTKVLAKLYQEIYQ